MQAPTVELIITKIGYSMIWKDCFGRPLVKGEDIVIGGHYGFDSQIALTAGIVIDMDDENITISYNWWEGEVESTGEIKYPVFQYPDGAVKCICKLHK